MPVTINGNGLIGGLADIKVPDGTASAPTISNIDDLNTGIFFPAADTIAFSEGGTEVIRINSSGNVGIGTTSPGALLHVLGAASGSPSIIASAGGNVAGDGGQVDFRVNTNPTFGSMSAVKGVLENMGPEQQGGLAFLTRPVSAGSASLTERMRITSAGNVGIGTSNPGVNLEISGANNTYPITRFRSRSNTGFHGGEIQFIRSREASGSDAAVAEDDYLGNLTFIGFDGSTNRTAAAIIARADTTVGLSDMPGRLQFYTTVDGGISLTEKMRINNAGLITGTGTSLGAWTTYTPTLGGTGWAIGNGTVAGEYVQIGKIVHFRGSITFGSTSTFGGSALTISLPATRATRTATGAIQIRMVDASTAKAYMGMGTAGSAATTFTPQSQVASTTGELANLTTNIPFTWATSDDIFFSGTYEIA